MNAQELIGKTADELQDMLMGLRKEQFALRMQFVSGQLTNPSLLSKARRDIARVKTAQNGGLVASQTAGTKTPKAKKASNKPVPQMKTTANVKAEPKKAAAKPAAKKAATKE